MQIRGYEVADRDAVIALSARLTVGVAPWRDPHSVRAAVRGWAVSSIDDRDPVTRPMFVAHDAHGAVIGYVSAGARVHWSGQIDAYVGELAIAETASRQGVGSTLMRTVQDWADTAGYRRLTLETGASNGPARAFYSALGYCDEDVRLSASLTEIRP